MDYNLESLRWHAEKKGKISVESKFEIKTKDDLSILYTPGVAEPCRKIAQERENVYKYCSKGNLVAIVSDGSSVLGLGNIGAEAAIPVMEGKAILFKKFAGVDAFPICLDTQDTDEIVETIKRIAPVFGGINLEDISAPRCFEIEERLRGELNIPVFHDDQHGTAVVCLAGLINALKVVRKKIEEVKIVINGAGAAGLSIAKLFLRYGAKDIVMCDSKGIIYNGREGLNKYKEHIASVTNKGTIKGSLLDAIDKADVFVGVSVAGALSKDMARLMNKDAIIFAMANPVPEIMPDEAKSCGARVYASGRSDFKNQINNVLVFPGIFRGALDSRVSDINENMMIRAAEAIASCVDSPVEENIIPSVFDEKVAVTVADAVRNIDIL